MGRHLQASIFCQRGDHLTWHVSHVELTEKQFDRHFSAGLPRGVVTLWVEHTVEI